MSCKQDYISKLNPINSAEYIKYSKAEQIPQLLHNLILIDCSPRSNEFKFKHGFIPALEGKQKTLLNVKLDRCSDGTPKVFCDSDTFNKYVWKTVDGYMIKIFDTISAKLIGENLYQDDKGRIYNSVTCELKAPIVTDLDSFYIQTSSFKSEELKKKLHKSKISKLYTTRSYSEKSNITSDTIWSGLVESNTASANWDYKFVIDLDNTYRNSKVIEVLKSLTYAPQIILKKNKYSNNNGSACAVWYFNKPLTSDERKRFTQLVTYYIAVAADSVSIDDSYKNYQNHQNPVHISEQNSQKLSHDCWLKASTPYTVEAFENQLLEYEDSLTEEQKSALSIISKNKKMLKSNKPFSKLFTAVERTEEASVRYMWNNVPEGSRNDVLNKEVIQLANEYFGIYSTADLFENTESVTKQIFSILWPSVSVRYNNSDGQITSDWCYKIVKQTVKWLKRKNASDTKTLNSSIVYAYNIVRKNQKSMFQELSGFEYDLSSFKYATSLRVENSSVNVTELHKIMRERSCVDKMFHSLIYEVAIARYNGYFNKLLDIAENNINCEMSEITKELLGELDSHYVNSNYNVNGSMKLIYAIAQYAQSKRYLKNTPINVESILCSMSEMEINNSGDSLSMTAFGHEKQVATQVTRKERNGLLAITWSEALLTLSKAEQNAVLHFTFVKTLDKICKEVDSLLNEFSIQQILPTGEIIISYSLVSKAKLEKKAFKELFTKYNIPLSIMFNVYDPILKVSKSEAKSSEVQKIVSTMNKLNMKELRDDIATDTQLALGELLCKVALSESGLDANKKSFLNNILMITNTGNEDKLTDQLYSMLYGVSIKLREQFSSSSYANILFKFAKVSMSGVKQIITRAKKMLFSMELDREDFAATMSILKALIRKCANIFKNTMKAAIIDIAERLHINLNSESISENEFATVNFAQNYKQILNFSLSV